MAVETAVGAMWIKLCRQSYMDDIPRGAAAEGHGKPTGRRTCHPLAHQPGGGGVRYAQGHRNPLPTGDVAAKVTSLHPAATSYLLWGKADRPTRLTRHGRVNDQDETACA
jgi:hypothetical protein